MYLSCTNRRSAVAANIVVIKNIRLTNRTCNYRRRNRVFNGSKRVAQSIKCKRGEDRRTLERNVGPRVERGLLQQTFIKIFPGAVL